MHLDQYDDCQEMDRTMLVHWNSEFDYVLVLSQNVSVFEYYAAQF